MPFNPTALSILMNPFEIALKTDIMGFCQPNSSPSISRCLITLSEPTVLHWFYLMCFLPFLTRLKGLAFISRRTNTVYPHRSRTSAQALQVARGEIIKTLLRII